MIDIKDLQVGSIILYGVQPRKVSVIEDNGYIRTATLDEKQGFNFSNVSQFEPIPITPEWLIRLGGHDLSASLGTLTYGFCPEADGPMPPDMVHVELVQDVWVFTYDKLPLRELTGIHHLQSLVWNLERTWLTFSS